MTEPEPEVTHYYRVIESAAAPWLALGWVEVGRDRVPSVAEEILLVEWRGDEEPKIPRPRKKATPREAK